MSNETKDAVSQAARRRETRRQHTHASGGVDTAPLFALPRGRPQA